jgi:hypothetical protein
MTSLNSALELASQGESPEIRAFLQLFKESTLSVLCKDQQSLSVEGINYPNRPLDIFAVQEDDRTVIPIFCSKEAAANWTSSPLKLREIQTDKLLAIVPDDWWISLNPGSEHCKEFSPWELKKLLGDQDDLEEIVVEISSEQGTQLLEVRECKEEDLPTLKSELQKFSDNNKKICACFAAVEIGETFEAQKVETLLIGFKVLDMSPSELALFRTYAKDSIAPLLIGSLNLRILVGVGFGDLELGIFADFPPLIQKNTDSK